MRNIRFFALMLALLVTTLMLAEQNADARAGGGRSMGSRGSRSYSRPVAPPSQMPSREYAPSRPVTPPYQQPYPQPSRGLGGFGGSFLGSMAGGMLGGMLFRSLGFGGGYGGGGGGGIGLFEIILLAGIGYMIYRMIKKKRAGDAGYGQSGKVIDINSYQSQDPYQQPYGTQSYVPQVDETGEGLSHIRQMDPGFDEHRFSDNVMDIFFKVQGAWMNRDLSSVSNLLTDEMRGIMQADLDGLIREKRVNRLENIAVRNVEVSEAWQESGKDFITALIYANLLDYTTDDSTGAVVAGSKTDPVKFEEYWTFTRPVGNNPWKLAAINQK
jgi:predicted lipid-binding transport protein (Tim44 family)